ncbi:hypothetical protein [Mesonia sp. K7]|nr:hypothetical protein [Mesonia sp. K7]
MKKILIFYTLGNHSKNAVQKYNNILHLQHQEQTLTNLTNYI